MPAYCFKCESCGESFEDYAPMSKINEFSTNCPQCKSKKVYRDFRAEKVGGFVEVRTVGMQAIRNTERKSADELNAIKERNFEYLKDRPSEDRNPRHIKRR